MRLRTPVCGHRARRGNCFIISFLHLRYASRGGSLMGLGQLYISLETSVLCEDWIYRGNLTILAEKTAPAPHTCLSRHSYPFPPARYIRPDTQDSPAADSPTAKRIPSSINVRHHERPNATQDNRLDYSYFKIAENNDPIPFHLGVSRLPTPKRDTLHRLAGRYSLCHANHSPSAD